MNERPVRRSELICPAHSMKMMTKAAASAADEVIFDLEDACAVSQKVPARETVCQAFATLDFTQGKVRAFRVNGPQTPWAWDDLEHVLSKVGAKVDVVVVPKVASAGQVAQLDEKVTQLERKHRLEPGRLRLEVLIESAQGLLSAEAIAKASPRLDSLIFGVADYAGDTGARDFKQNAEVLFYYPRAHILAAARAAGIDAIDSVTVQYKDPSQTERDAKAGARLGYDGKWAIHPSQLEAIHAAYTPSADELVRARRVIAAYEEAQRKGEGAIVLDDEMVDAATLKVEAKKLQVARRAGLV